jgi:hypothetical protein
MERRRVSETELWVRMRTFLVVLLCLLGAVGGNVWQHLHGAKLVRDADERYARAERDFTEQFECLKSDLADARTNLGRAEALNRAARAGVERITNELNGNVQSIQEAKRIISTIRDAVAALENSLLGRDTDSGGNRRTRFRAD